MQEDQDKELTFQQVSKFVFDFSKFLLSRKLIIVLSCVFGVGFGILYYKIQSPNYQGLSSFVLQEKGSSSSGLAGIASQLGLDFATGSSGGSLFAGENIVEILQSKNIVNKVLLSDVVDEQNKKIKYIDRYLSFYKFKKKWENKEGLSNINYNNIQPDMLLTLKQDSVLQLVYRLISKNLEVERTSKKTTIIKVNLKEKDPVLAKVFTERLISEAATFYIQVKTTLLRKNVERLERRADSILGLLNKKSYEAAVLRVTDANTAIKTVAIPTELAARDRSVLLTLYGEVVKNLEYNRINLVQETPVIQLLDKPSSTLYDNRKGLVFCLLIGISVVTVIVGSILLVLFFRFNKK
jgi:hypothetical protein